MSWSAKPLRLAALGAIAALGACNDYVARKDTIAWSAGDAVAYNKAIHVIDPWPPASADTRIPTSGRRVADAIERYEVRANVMGNGGGGGAVPIAAPQ
ncbi:MAG TPA: hypothetical protein VIL65_16170 [Beijerinckiaceae bacterium]|jgi:hypothetical protein